MDPEAFLEAMIDSFNGDEETLTAMIAELLADGRPGARRQRQTITR